MRAGSGVWGAAKPILERVVRLARGSPRRMRHRALVLAYHNVVPDGLAGRGDRSLHLPMSTFLRQMDLLQAHCRIVPLIDILAGVRDDDRPVVAITFDDAYRGAVEHALPELSRRGLRSALFVAPGLLGAQSLWWDELAAVPDGLSGTLRATVLQSDAGRQSPARERIAAQASATLLPDCYHCASEEQMIDLATREAWRLALTAGVTRIWRASMGRRWPRSLRCHLNGSGHARSWSFRCWPILTESSPRRSRRRPGGQVMPALCSSRVAGSLPMRSTSGPYHATTCRQGCRMTGS